MENMSPLLKELAEAKTEFRQKGFRYKQLKELISDENAAQDWCDDIDHQYADYYDPDSRDYEPKDIHYSLFENEKLEKAKDKLEKKAEAMDELRANSPQKKVILTHKYEIFDAVLIILAILFIGELILTIFKPSSFLIILSALIFIGICLYLFLHKKLIDQIKEHKAIKKQNAENAEFNETAYKKLSDTYTAEFDKLYDEYKKILDKDVLNAVKECIEAAKREEEPLMAELTKLYELIQSDKFSVYSIRDCNTEQLETMAKYLDTGRAENYKEALNLYLQEQSEQEHRREMRQLEEERIRTEQERAIAEKRHYDAMERQAREAAEAAQKAEQQHHAAMEKQANETSKAAKKQAEILEAEYRRKCMTCKYSCIGSKYCKGYEPKETR